MEANLKTSSLKSYEDKESTLISYARKLETDPDTLDTAIWIVMRVYQKDNPN
jgi:3-deoxy-D-arabino-heptulosonate 7-phosphate (DAHP) synthase